jgi:hypothetical protein
MGTLLRIALKAMTAKRVALLRAINSAITSPARSDAPGV